MSFLCCCCGANKSLPPLNEDEVHGILQRDDGSSREDLVLFAAMWCRGSKAHPLQRQLPQVGTRQRKHFCWVMGAPAGTSSSGGSEYFGWLFPSSRRAVLSITACERTIGLHERGHLERALGVRHPLLLGIISSDLPRPDRVVVVREWCPGGSLRDVLHGASPELEQTTKYDRVGTPLSEYKIALIGRGLLEALLVLRPLGERVCVHVHLGNVFLDGADGLVPRLAEWENGLLGLPSHLESYFDDLRRSVEPACAALALCVYEMSCGFELDGLPAVIPPTCPRTVREALEAMLARAPPRRKKKGAEVADAGVFTLEDARALPLFASVAEAPANARVGYSASPPPPLPSDVVKAAKEIGRGV